MERSTDNDIFRDSLSFCSCSIMRLSIQFLFMFESEVSIQHQCPCPGPLMESCSESHDAKSKQPHKST